MGDYCDGELFRKNELFQQDPCALQIQLYYDELEVCNPLGSKAKKHKLGICFRYEPVVQGRRGVVTIPIYFSPSSQQPGPTPPRPAKNHMPVLLLQSLVLFPGCLYYTLGNLDPKLRSSLKNIHLLCIVKHEIITKYGIEEILKPVIDDILKLESVSTPLCSQCTTLVVFHSLE